MSPGLDYDVVTVRRPEATEDERAVLAGGIRFLHATGGHRGPTFLSRRVPARPPERDLGAGDSLAAAVGHQATEPDAVLRVHHERNLGLPRPGHDGTVRRCITGSGPEPRLVVGVELVEVERPVRSGPRRLLATGPSALGCEQEVDLGGRNRMARLIDNDAVEADRVRELQVGDSLVGLDFEVGIFLGYRAEIRLRQSLGLDVDRAGLRQHRVSPLGIGPAGAPFPCDTS